MTIQSAQQQVLLQLKMLYDEREAVNITNWVMEHVTGKERIDRLLDKQQMMDGELVTKLKGILEELATHKPIQYVLGEAWFAGMKFYVNPHTLIPRPETEELVDWIKETIQHSTFHIQTIIDIGTGSGCIPIALKKKLPKLSVTSVDVSKDALEVAQKNAHALQAAIELQQIDFLNEATWNQLPVFDMVVSNPPYIKQSEQASMAKHVLDFEPAIALFVPDEDPLIFYRKIAVFGNTHLAKGGSIFLEINEMLGKEVMQLFESAGYVAELKKDLQQKDRMLRVTGPH